MSTHRALALVGSLGLSAIALGDAVTHGVTGHYSVFADDSGHDVLIVLGEVVHGLAYVGLALVLRDAAAAFCSYGRILRGTRRLLIAAFALLAPCMLLLGPLVGLTGREDGPLAAADSVVATTAFMAMLVGTLALAIGVLRRNELGLGGQVLRLMLPVALATAGLGFVAQDWAHPGYLETTVNLGVALIGVGAVSTVRRESAVLTSA
jgi:hypothetical protein